MSGRNTIDHMDIVRIVNAAVDRAGGQSAMAARLGRTRQGIHAQLAGRLEFSDDVLSFAGVRRVVTTHYEIVEQEHAHAA